MSWAFTFKQTMEAPMGVLGQDRQMFIGICK